MKKYKIFEIEYLQNSEFTEEDLVYLLETPSFSLSLAVAMFRLYDKSDMTDEKIVNIVKTDNNWMYKHYWTKKQRDEFLSKLTKCYRNLYRYNNDTCEKLAQMWLVNYGFTSAKQKKKRMLLLSD